MAAIHDDAVTTFGDLRMGRDNIKFVSLKIDADNGGDIVVDTVGTKDEYPTHEDLVAALPSDEPRWVAFNFSYETTGGARSKTCLINWVPADASRVGKMQAALWMNNIKQALDGIQCIVQAGDVSECDYEAVLDRASRFEREEILARAT